MSALQLAQRVVRLFFIINLYKDKLNKKNEGFCHILKNYYMLK